MKKVLFLVGPTASGKTRLSLEIARKLNAEIVSADSRQIYKFLDIGTAKPSLEELKEFPHHFINMYDPDEDYNAGKFSKEARLVIDQILKSKKLPIVVGGSGLYIKALIEGFSVDNVSDSRIREALTNRLEREGIESLYSQLEKIDHKSAESIHKNNTQRIMRAIEVYILTGKPISEYKSSASSKADFQPVIFGLDMQRDQLYENIETRIDVMLEEGLIPEVAILQRKGYNENLNSLQTVGYKEVFSYFNGDFSYEEMIRLIKKNTRNYAKRQMTWFKNNAVVNWLSVTNESNFKELADQVIESFKKTKTS
jgi:tRNA dimethylallyltransferase